MWEKRTWFEGGEGDLNLTAGVGLQSVELGFGGVRTGASGYLAAPGTHWCPLLELRHVEYSDQLRTETQTQNQTKYYKPKTFWFYSYQKIFYYIFIF